MGPIGLPEMMGIFVIALLLFGPKKLPELGRLLAKGLTEFRRAKNELKTTFEGHLRELEKEANLESTYTPPPSITSGPSYSYSYDEYGHNSEAETPAALPEASRPELPAAPTPEPVPTRVDGTIPRSNGIGHVTTPAHVTSSQTAAEHEEHPA